MFEHICSRRCGLVQARPKDAGKMEVGCVEYSELWLVFLFADTDSAVILGQAVSRLPDSRLCKHVQERSSVPAVSVGKWCELARSHPVRSMFLCVMVAESSGYLVCEAGEEDIFDFHLNNEH